MNSYLTQAQELLLLSKKELDKAKQMNDDNLARDASGKAWIATTDALRGFLLSQGLKQKELPKGERQRQNMLMQYGNERMRLLYSAIRSEFHENAYYEGLINYSFLFEALRHVKKFVHRCDRYPHRSASHATMGYYPCPRKRRY